MANIERLNELIRFMLNDRREECENDEERAIYDRLKRENDRMTAYGIGVDMVNDVTP